MSSENRCYYFSENYQTVAQQDYFAKREIIKKFNNREVDITGETHTVKYADLLGFCQGLRNTKKVGLFAVDRFRPLTALALRGAQPYKANRSSDAAMLNCTVAGGTDLGCRYDDTDENIA